MRKDKQTTVRINLKIYSILKARGFSIQKILDEWIRKNIKVKND